LKNNTGWIKKTALLAGFKKTTLWLDLENNTAG